MDAYVLLVYLNQFVSKDSAQKHKPDARLNSAFQIRKSTILEWSRLCWENFPPDTSNSTSSITWLGVFDISSFEIILEQSKNCDFLRDFLIA
jgi:hypothetical protein